MVSASVATWSSVYSMPASSHTADLVLLDRARGVGDVGLVLAEHLEAATRAGLADGDLDVGVLTRLSSSAAASLSGKTVEEPSTATEPLTPSVSVPEAASWPPPQAVSTSARAAMAGTIARRDGSELHFDLLKVCVSCLTPRT